LNGYKIANPTVLARISHEELESLFIGYGYKPYFVEGSDPETMHQLMAATLDTIIEEIKAIQRESRIHGFTERPQSPMIILRSPKGWTGPEEVDGNKTEDYWRSHQVPFAEMASKPEHIKLLEEWMKSYKPEEVFNENGKLIDELAELAPKGQRRMGDNPDANGGILLRDLKMPELRNYTVEVPKPGVTITEATRVMGKFLRDVIKLNLESRNFRMVGPDETASNRLGDAFDVTDRTWVGETLAYDDHLSADGRVMKSLANTTARAG